MRLVIDSNRFAAGLLRDSVSRKIIYNNYLEFFAPQYLITEIEKYIAHFARKTNRSEEQIGEGIAALLENVRLLPSEEFERETAMADAIMKDIDERDAPFLAVGMAIGADGIWTEDRHFQKQNTLKVYSTKDLLDFVRAKERTW